MKTSRLLKAEIILLVCVAVLWAVDLKTACVPRATAGALRQVIKVAPNSQCAYELLGSTYHYLGRADEGDQAYEQAEILSYKQAVESNATDPNAHYQLGDAYFDQERYEDAVEAYRKSIELDPNGYMAHYSLGIALDWLDRYEEEIEAFQEAIRLNPDDADAHFNLGDAYYELGDLGAAIQTYEEVLRLDSAYGDGYKQLAGCYSELDQLEKSIETWKRAISAIPEWTWPHVALAFDYNDVGRYDEAIAEWKYLIELEPEMAGLHALLADVYLKTGQHSEAIAACEAGLRINPDHPKSHYNLGRAHLQTGNKDLASEEYEALKALDGKLADDLLELLRNRHDAPKPAEQTTPIQDGSLGQDEASQLRALDAELSNLESYAAQERENIETWYSGRVAEWKAWFDQRLEALGDADKVAWVQFQQRANETWSTTTGHEYGSVYDGGYGSAYGYGSSFGTTYTFVKGNPAGEYAAFLAQIKNSKQATQQDFLNAQQKLALLRQQKLDALKAEIKRRKSRMEREFSRKLAGDRTPMVDAIGIAADSRFYAMMGDAFVYEGNTVQGYRVRKIRADSVEFEKDGEVWVQKMQ